MDNPLCSAKPDGYRTATLDRSWIGPERADYGAAYTDAKNHLLTTMKPPVFYSVERRFGREWQPDGEHSVRELCLILRWADGAITEESRHLYGRVVAPQCVVGERSIDAYAANEPLPCTEWNNCRSNWHKSGVFRLLRVTRADALGPVEALYEEITDLDLYDIRFREKGVLRLLLADGAVADLDRETGILAWPDERWRRIPPSFSPRYAYEPGSIRQPEGQA